MNLFWAILFLIGGLTMLWKSADLLVAGAVSLAERLGISPLIVGLTVVAMGTSAPEVAASIAAVLRETGGGDIAIGNVFGSNIANLALVGGLIALIRPLRVRKYTLVNIVPVMIAVALLLWPVLNNNFLSRLEALILLVIFLVLIAFTIRKARKEAEQAKLISENIEKAPKYSIGTMQKSLLFIVIGLVGLALGAKITVAGAVFIGEQLGMSDRVIGLTIIAFGTSLPELITCVVATIKAQSDISVGNLVGSNIFNTLLVTGGAGLVRPYEVSSSFAGGLDYWIMIIISIAFVGAIMIGRRVIGRISGVVLLCSYFAYIIYLFSSGS